MPTLFTGIYDLFLVQVQDYKTDVLYDQGVNVLNDYLAGFLRFAINRFARYCDQDIVATADYTTGQFTIILTAKNQIMLAKEMKVFWAEREVNNVLQFENLLSDTDFKRHSESANLREKRILLNDIIERVSQEELDYHLMYQRSRATWEASDFFV